MALTRRIQTNFSKGELSPLLEGRPDLTGYNEGCRTLENFMLQRQATVTRRVGTRFIAEVKSSASDTMLIPFEAGLSNSFAIEVGNKYMRFVKNKVLSALATLQLDQSIRAERLTVAQWLDLGRLILG